MAVAAGLGPRLDRERFQWSSLVMLSPALVLLGVLFVFPVLYACYLGFTNLAPRPQALAYPLFGTTATHVLALRQKWGATNWEAWYRALQANQPFVLNGNSVVVNFVGRGEAWVGLTDSDDIAAEQAEGAPITPLPMTEETLLIPNTVAISRQPPHPEMAERLFAYLQRTDVAERLVAAKALEGTSLPAAATPTLNVDWDDLLRDLERTTAKLNEIFLR